MDAVKRERELIIYGMALADVYLDLDGKLSTYNERELDIHYTPYQQILFTPNKIRPLHNPTIKDIALLLCKSKV